MIRKILAKAKTCSQFISICLAVFSVIYFILVFKFRAALPLKIQEIRGLKSQRREPKSTEKIPVDWIFRLTLTLSTMTNWCQLADEPDESENKGPAREPLTVLITWPSRAFFEALAEGKETTLSDELRRLLRADESYRDNVWALILAAAALSGKRSMANAICDFVWAPPDLPEAANVALSRDPMVVDCLRAAKKANPAASLVAANNLLLDLTRARDRGDALPMSNGIIPEAPNAPPT